MYLDPLIEDLACHLDRKGKLLSLAEKTAQIENFREGASLAQSFIDRYESIEKCAPLQIIELIEALHAKTAAALYESRPTERAGHFRQDDAFVLRHPPLAAEYSEPLQYGRIAKFLKDYAGPLVALNYLIGYYKFFIVDHPKVSASEVEKFQKGITQFAKILGMPFEIACLSNPMSNEEEKALDKVYKIFPRKGEVPQKILEWAIALQREVQAGQDLREVFARYYLLFIDIHPFIDGNSRVVTLFLNTLLLAQGYSPFFLNAEAHRLCDHYFDRGEPDPTGFIAYVKRQVSPPASYRALGWSTQTTLFLQNMSRKDRIAVDAIFRPDSQAIKESVFSKLTEAHIPYSLKAQCIFVKDINSEEVATRIQDAMRLR